MSDFGSNYFWESVSGSHEAKAHAQAVTFAKVAAATWWPFLAHSADETEFENRLSLVSNKIEAAVDPEVYDEVISSLRDDFRAVHEASRNSAQSTSPELAGFNDALHSRQADLTDGEFFDQQSGKWVVATRREDGGYDWAPKEATNYKPDPDEFFNTATGKWERIASYKDINDKGCPDCGAKWKNGKLQHDADCPTLKEFDPHHEKKEATNYKPDPDRAWRYYQPYEHIDGVQPVNNGDLQDSDGFPVDLAQGENRASERIQFQLTPGQWTQHDGMPERPMPQGQARGYVPVNASLQTQAEYKYVKQQGSKWVVVQKGTGKVLSHHDSEEDAKASFRAMEMHKHEGSLVVDENGFLVQASDVAQEGVRGRAVEPLQDPAPGAPVKVNPYYFNPEGDMGANEGFPVAPSEDPQDRANMYGDQAPQPSAGSTQGTSDGKGYSRSYPGESPNFSDGGKTAAIDWDRTDTPDRSLEERHNEWQAAHPIAKDEDFDRRWGLDQPPVHQTDPADDWYRGPEHHGEGGRTSSLNEHGQFIVHTPEEHAQAGFYDAQMGRPYVGHHENLENASAYRRGWEAYHNRKESSTDGRIVDHCPGCEKPRRVHATPHGDEVRHLHNNHVRCHGDRTAKKDDSLPQFFDPTLSNGSVHTADYLGRPDASNPTGRGPDEYRANTWDSYLKTRPFQSPEDRRVNTPMLPGDQLRTRNVNTPTPGLKDGLQVTRDEDEEDDDDDD